MPSLRGDEILVEFQAELGVQSVRLEAKSLETEVHLLADLGNVVRLVDLAAVRTPKIVESAVAEKTPAADVLRGAVRKLVGRDDSGGEGDDQEHERGRDKQPSQPSAQQGQQDEPEETGGDGMDEQAAQDGGGGHRAATVGKVLGVAGTVSGAAAAGAVAGALGRDKLRSSPVRRAASKVPRSPVHRHKTAALGAKAVKRIQTAPPGFD